MIVNGKKHMGSGLENTLAVWAPPEFTSAIYDILADIDIEVYACDSACDLVMIPNFIQVIDGRLMVDSDDDLPFISCLLTNYSGRMTQCNRCRHHKGCLTVAESRTTEQYDNDNYGPEYKAPTIILHPEARQQNIEGLLAIVSPMENSENFSDNLFHWLRSKILHWRMNALAWRANYEKWQTLEEIRWSMRKAQKDLKRTSAEIAQERWQPRNISIDLKGFDFM